jgi:hypothetical protein
METVVLGLDEFRDWYLSLEIEAQESIDRVVGLLEVMGVRLGHPYSTAIAGSSIAMRELRVQSSGEPYRILYVFDPARQAVLLLGGNKVGKGNRWYESAIRIAERLYAEYLKDVGGE